MQGVQPERYTRVIRMDDKLVAGEFRVQPGEAVIGKDLASDLGIGVGDRFRLVTGSGSGRSTMPTSSRASSTWASGT